MGKLFLECTFFNWTIPIDPDAIKEELGFKTAHTEAHA